MAPRTAEHIEDTEITEASPLAVAPSPSTSRPVMLGRSIIADGGADSSNLEEPAAGHLAKAGETGSDSRLIRTESVLSRAGTALQRAGSTLKPQSATALPTDARDLRYAATMPSMYDIEAPRPHCGGLWKTPQFLGFLLGATIFAVLVCSRPIRTYPASNDMLGITALCACLWIFEVIPVYMTAVFPLVLMPLLKVTSSEIAAKAYWSWISLLVMGVFLVGLALEEAQLPRRLALNLLLSVGSVRPAVLLACFMAICWVLAMFCNSIAVTLLLAPFAISLLNATEEHVRNSSAVELEEEGDVGADELACTVEQKAREVQKFSRALLLGIAFSATSGGLATLTGAISNYFLPGESIVAEDVVWSKWFLFALPISIASVLTAYGVLYAQYVRSLRINGIQREVLLEECEQLLKEVGPLSRDELLVGMVQALQIILLIIRPSAISPFVQTVYGINLVNDATLACAPALLLFFLPSSMRPGQALLAWPAVQEKFDFGLLLLIGGSLAINKGFTESGLNVALGDLLAQTIPHIPPLALDLLIIASVTLSTQLFSGIGTAAAMLPVLGAAAREAVVNPLALMLPATVATSFTFLLPTATPANVIVFAKSQELQKQLRIRDFACAGAPLTLAIILAGALLTHLMGVLVFDAQAPFPQWACSAQDVVCLFAPVPGEVRGRPVEAQACMLLTGREEGELCRLWNGTLLNTTLYSLSR